MKKLVFAVLIISLFLASCEPPPTLTVAPSPTSTAAPSPTSPAIPGITEPVIVRAVELLFTGVGTKTEITIYANTWEPRMADVFIEVFAKTSHGRASIPCGWGDEEVILSWIRDGKHEARDWQFCLYDESTNLVTFLFPGYIDVEDLAITFFEEVSVSLESFEVR